MKPSCHHCSNLNKFRPAYMKFPIDHYLRETRDRNSPIACPVLKNTKCLNCGRMGHTQSHCLTYSRKFEEIVPLVDHSKVDNRFDVLMEDDSSVEYASSVEDASSSFEGEFLRDGTFRPKSPDYPPPFYTDEHFITCEKV